jgi:Ferritin-like
MRALIRLMTVPAEKRDVPWLKESLQAAIELEMSTIPPYLYAAWSIDLREPPADPANPPDPAKVRGTIMDIAKEEMLHMGLACNLLASIGGQPKILQRAPRYPAQLPKDIHKGLPVALAPLTELVLKTFMAIEEPVEHLVDDPDFTPSGSKLIGQFYRDLLRRFEAPPSPSISATGQVNLVELFGSFNVTGPFGNDFIFRSLEHVRVGIDLITRQGEGTAKVPFESRDNPDELAHFYQFGEIFHRHRLTRTRPFSYTGGEVKMPPVRLVSPADNALPASIEFNRAYTGVLKGLEDAWNGGSADLFSVAFNDMPELSRKADRLIADGFGPAFVVVDDSGVPVPPPTAGQQAARVTDQPDAAVRDPAARLSLTTGAFRPDPSVHVAYFRDLDNWSNFQATADVRAAVNDTFAFFDPWVAFARDPSQEQAWIDSLSGEPVRQSVAMLSDRQQQTVEAHYGVPVPLLTLLDGFERFGNDGLPDDPDRPQAPRHNMNAAIMWFVLSAFAEACLRLEISAEFWVFYMRAILCGLLNDGLFRGRLTVQGFQATPEGRLAVFQHAQAVADADLPAELRRRYMESGFAR